ncbi:SDR family oxidoreductase [Frigoriglobus tundricola]|uniref:SDR family oxidoreductase n=1 Tax=Frigoriglobus tundricola TaxID=2774151 RepID=A0A6M5YTS9_9BACT|nr:SDR family oxidoreductase [Frigoriglobus tundricola]QJW96733.1 SDR family oxidoreductase [Frigoriglobus tundricola]
MTSPPSPRRALVVGSTGLVGNNLADRLLADGWSVAGLARKAVARPTGLRPVTADLLRPDTLGAALAGESFTHVFFCTWTRCDTEAENIRVNAAMVRNLLDAVRPLGGLRHVALVTGLKHYLGPFESYGKGNLPDTPFREEQGRLPVENFYYAQEDEVFAAAARDGFTWTVHRPHTIIGFTVGNAMNMGVTLAAYASLCKHVGRPFLFPGSPQQWNGMTDVTDARLLARHLEWAATTPAAADRAFNVVNGDLFRWRWLWPRLAAYFGVAAAEYPAHPTPLVAQMAGDTGPWADLARKHGLAEPDLGRLTSAWHTDADLGRPMEVMADMSRSRRLGFSVYQTSLDSFTDLFGRLRRERLIP